MPLALWFSPFTRCFKVPTPKTNLIDAALLDDFPDLPDDVLLEILTKLPAKVIGRYMCVCKKWHSLFKSSFFVSLHSNSDISQRNRHLVLWKDDDQLQFHIDNQDLDYCKIQTVPIGEIYNFPAENCIAICKGLICLAKDKFTFVLWNPTIKKMLALPRPNIHIHSEYIQRLGFAFDSAANDYKVFRILEYGRGKESHIQTFSLNHNCWRFGPQIDQKYYFGEQSPPAFNGVIHWIAYERRGNKYERRGNISISILGFDVNAEFFRHIKFPDSNTYCGLETKLVIYQDSSLGVLFRHGFNLNVKLELWVMKEYGNVESWVNIWKFDDVSWHDVFILSSLRRTVVKIPQGRSRKRFWRLFPILNERMITEITNEKDYKVASAMRLVASHVLRPLEETLLLLDNSNAVDVESMAMIE